MRSSSFTKPTIDILTIDEFWRDGQREHEYEASLKKRSRDPSPVLIEALLYHLTPPP